MAEPAWCWITADKISKKCVFRAACAIETKAAIRWLALIRASVFDENAASESGKLKKHSNLLVEWAKVPVADCLLRYVALLWWTIRTVKRIIYLTGF